MNTENWIVGSVKPTDAELWKIAKVLRRHCSDSSAWTICAQSKDQWYYFNPYSKSWVPVYQNGEGIICGFSDQESAINFFNKHKPKKTLNDVPYGYKFTYMNVTVLKSQVYPKNYPDCFVCVSVEHGAEHYVDKTYVIE